jgi:hypothetical protein
MRAWDFSEALPPAATATPRTGLHPKLVAGQNQGLRLATTAAAIIPADGLLVAVIRAAPKLPQLPLRCSFRRGRSSMSRCRQRRSLAPWFIGTDRCWRVRTEGLPLCPTERRPPSATTRQSGADGDADARKRVGIRLTYSVTPRSLTLWSSRRVHFADDGLSKFQPERPQICISAAFGEGWGLWHVGGPARVSVRNWCGPAPRNSTLGLGTQWLMAYARRGRRAVELPLSRGTG